jgi:hydrogenase maturation protease
MSAPRKILVAGIGNIFFGDDAFGCEVVRELSRHPLPENVRVIDFGIRGFDLAFALMDDYAATILVDAVPRGQAPGTVYLIEPHADRAGDTAEIPNAHSLSPASVLQMVRSMGGQPRSLYLVGCEPAVLEGEEGAMGLSETVQAALPRAIETIEKLIHDLLSEIQKTQRIPSLAGAKER